jgi:hypothetical protein
LFWHLWDRVLLGVTRDFQGMILPSRRPSFSIWVLSAKLFGSIFVYMPSDHLTDVIHHLPHPSCAVSLEYVVEVLFHTVAALLPAWATAAVVRLLTRLACSFASVLNTPDETAALAHVMLGSYVRLMGAGCAFCACACACRALRAGSDVITLPRRRSMRWRTACTRTLGQLLHTARW